MVRNVGPKERYARLALGAATGVAAMRSTGWQRTALGAVAAAELVTGLTRYCPINQAVGRRAFDGESMGDGGMRDADLRRHAAMSSALGTAPSTGTGQPLVTPGNAQFEGA
jgi:hypothetical protein